MSEEVRGDITQRLRGHYVTGLGDKRDFSPFVQPICIEAAGEIERLRKLLEESEQRVGYLLEDSDIDICELDDEIKRSKIITG